MSRRSPLHASSVYVRVRPETYEGGHSMLGKAVSKQLHGWDNDSVVIGWQGSYTDVGKALATGKRYSFPKVVIPPEASQEEMANTMLLPLVDKLLGDPDSKADPINVLFFAYGQTGTGKTHTMLGPDSSLSPPEGHVGYRPGDPAPVHPDWGCFPRVVHEVFSRLERRGRPFVVSMTACEFYLMVGSDLLNDNAPMEVTHEHEAAGLRQVILRHPAQALEVLATARRNRHTRSTRMNESRGDGADKPDEHAGSSRSHALLALNVAQLDPATNTYVETAFNLIDLAGAERPDKTGEERKSGMDAWKEIVQGKPTIGAQGTIINLELSFLADQVRSATDIHRSGAPYKPRKALTTQACRLFGGCFGGTYELAMVVTLSQAPQCGWETWFSCEYGTQLAGLRAPYIPQRWGGVEKSVAAAQRKISETQEQLDRKSAGGLQYELLRRSIIIRERNRLEVLDLLQRGGTAAGAPLEPPLGPAASEAPAEQ